MAIEHERLEVISYLLDSGLDVDPISMNAALEAGSTSVLQTLVAHGWDINQTGRGLPVLKYDTQKALACLMDFC